MWVLLSASSAAAAMGDCGQPVSVGPYPTAVDALYVLRAAIQADYCDLELCDVNSDCTLTVTDAFETLREAISLSSSLVCAEGCQALVPCGTSPSPVCGGSCPGGSVCTVMALDEDDPGVVLCHQSAGNPDLARTILADQDDLDVHLAHGDAIGPCENDPGDTVCHCEDVGTTTTIVSGSTTSTTVDIGSTTTTTMTIDLDNDGIEDDLDPCVDDPRNRCYGPVARDAVSDTPLRVNANASEAACAGPKTDCNGDLWVGDYGFSLPSGNETCNYPDGCPIAGIDGIFGCAGTETADLFTCGRFVNATVQRTLSYSFAVTGGEYLVNLYFANTFTGTGLPGQRVFDIVVEGKTAHPAFDQVAAAPGTQTAVVRSVVTNVDDGVLDISFKAAIENPAIKAIEVLSPYQTP